MAIAIYCMLLFSCTNQSNDKSLTMNKSDTTKAYELSRVFATSPDKVFNTFIDETTLKKIWGVSEIKIDARPGGEARAKLQIDNENWNFTIIYKEVIPYEKLSWVVHFDRFPAKETRATLLFRKLTDGTELTFRQENFETSQERDDNRQANEHALRILDSLLK